MTECRQPCPAGSGMMEASISGGGVDVERETGTGEDLAGAQKPGAGDSLANGDGRGIEIRDSSGFLIGDHGVQVNNIYYPAASPGTVAPPPMVRVSGEIEFPYRGLQAFGEHDAAVFFGREAAATEILQRLSAAVGGPGLLIVSGASGAGKSSLLQAGVVPRRAGAGLADAADGAPWPCLMLTPGSAPLDELAARIAPLTGASAATLRGVYGDVPERFALSAREAAGRGRSGRRRRLLLIVDQFEQLFTRCSDEGERQAFIAALHAAATIRSGPELVPPILVLLAVRADFEARCAEYLELRASVQDRYLLTAMTETELRLAITEPARRAGSGVDDALVEELIRQAGRVAAPRTRRRGHSDGTQALPLLSYVLDQAWRNRTGDTLGLADYARVDGMGSIAASAEEAYGGLSEAHRAAVRQIFMRMTTTNADGTVSSARVTRAELAIGLPDGDVNAVLEAFADEKVRLLTLGADSVEISHEVLLTAWDRLARWLDGDLDNRVRYSRLVDDARTWDESLRAPSYLYQAGRIAEVDASARRWDSLPGRYPPLDETTAAFVGASRKAMRVRRRWIQGGIAAFSALVLGAGFAVGTAVFYRGNANQKGAIALSEELALGSTAFGISEPVFAGQLAVAAWHASPTIEAQSAMTALLTGQQQQGILPSGTGPFQETGGVAFSPGGRVMATWGNELKLWDVTTRTLLATGTDSRYASDAVFSGNGRLLATVGNGDAQLRSPVTGTVIGRPFPPTAGTSGNGAVVTAVAFSPDGKVLASADSAGYIRLWNTATGAPVGRPLPVDPHDEAGVTAVAFSPDGRVLVSAGGGVQFWDAVTGIQVAAAKPDHDGRVTELAFSPDGAMMATASSSGYVRLWNTATRRMVGKPLLGGSRSFSNPAVAFNPDGRSLVTIGGNGNAQLWNVAARSARPIPVPAAIPARGPGSVAFSPDGTLLAIATSRGAVRLVRTATWRPLGAPLRPVRAGTPAYGVAFSPDGHMLAVAGSDGYVQLWDPATGTHAGKPLLADQGSPDGGVSAVAFSPDGTLLASADGNGYVRFWDPATGSPVGHSLPANLGDQVHAISFSPDGRTLAVNMDNGLIGLWNVITRQRIGKPLRVEAGVSGGTNEEPVFSPRGNVLATVDLQGGIHLWDTATGTQVRAITGLPGGASIAFSPDGSLLASSDPNGEVKVWNVSTGRVLSDASSTLSDNFPLATEQGLAVAFSPDGKLLATIGGASQLQLRDPLTGAGVGLPVTLDSMPEFLAFSPDGTTLAATEANGEVQLWQTRLLADPYGILCAEVGPPTGSFGIANGASPVSFPVGTCAAAWGPAH